MDGQYSIRYNDNGTVTIKRDEQIIATGSNILKVLEELRRFSHTDTAEGDVLEDRYAKIRLGFWNR